MASTHRSASVEVDDASTPTIPQEMPTPAPASEAEHGQLFDDEELGPSGDGADDEDDEDDATQAVVKNNYSHNVLTAQLRKWLCETIDLRMREAGVVKVDYADLAGDQNIGLSKLLEPVKQDLFRKVSVLDLVTVERLVEDVFSYQALKYQPPDQSSGTNLTASEQHGSAGDSPEKPSGSPGDDLGEDKEFKMYRLLIAQRLSALVNLSRRGHETKFITVQEVWGVDPFEEDNMIEAIWIAGYDVDPRSIRAIMRQASCEISTVDVQKVGGNDNEYGHMDATISWLKAAAIPRNSKYRPSARSQHPTGQREREFEKFVEDPANPGQWLVVFEKKLPNGVVYRQVDPMPSYNPDVMPLKLATGEKETYIDGTDGKIPTYGKFDFGRWNKIDDEAGGTYNRLYDKEPRDKSRLEAKARPKFVVRRFHRATNEYIWLCKFGQNWDAWDDNVQKFDVTRYKHCQVYNRWIQQILERQDHRYEKRVTRQCWSASELSVLRRHFNDIINQYGLIDVHLNGQWEEAVRKVNDVRMAHDAGAEKRSLNGVCSQADRHFYPASDMRMGIDEWRRFGGTLHDLHVLHPKVDIPDHILKPKDVIPMDDIVDKHTGNNEIAKRRKFADAEEKSNRKPVKLHADVKNGVLRVWDNFQGRILLKHGLSSVIPSQDQSFQDQGTQPVVDEQEVIEQEQEGDEPGQKRQKMADGEAK